MSTTKVPAGKALRRFKDGRFNIKLIKVLE